MKANVCLGIAALLLAACGANEDRRAGPGQPPVDNGNNGGTDPTEEAEEVTLFVESVARDCILEGQHLCLLVRESEEGDIALLPGVDAIEGFDYRWGFSYELRMLVYTVPDPPADGSSERYELVEVISQSEDTVGSTYELLRVEWYEADVTFRRSGDNYLFLGQAFSCADNVDCEALYELNNPGAEVNLTFRYLGHDSGDAPIELTNWE